MKCGACGAVGHMRTNKECPLYVTGEEALVPGATMGENTDEEAGMQVADEELINVEGTKITLSKAVFDRYCNPHKQRPTPCGNHFFQS